MSSKSKQQSPQASGGKGRYPWRSHGPALVIMALVMLFAAGAWVMTYTASLHPETPSKSQPIDPAPEQIRHGE